MTVPIARPPRARPFILIGLALLVAGVLLVIASNLDRGRSEAPSKPRIVDATDAVAPAPLTDAERRGGGARVGDDPLVQLEQGAWVQVTDETGRLAQQYSARAVEPLPDREMRLDAPKAVMFQPDGRVIVLTADRGKARVPKKALESGTLNDHVVIRLFRPAPGCVVDTAHDEPVTTVKADDAHFDSVLGEIRCEGPVHVASDLGTFHGRGMTLLVNPKGGQLERLVVDKCTEPMVFIRGADGKTRPATARDAAPAQAPAPAVNAAGNATSVPSPPTAAPAKVTPFYRLTLEDQVHVVRIKDGRTSTLDGDELTAIFALEGGAALGNVASAAPLGPQQRIAAAAFAASSQSDDTVAAKAPMSLPNGGAETVTIDYAGRLVLEPADDSERLASKDDVWIELRSRDELPDHRVTLRDDASKATVTCRRVTFQTGIDLVEAFGWPTRPLLVHSPRLQASGERFWLMQTPGQAGFSGPGAVTLASGGETFALMAFDADHANVTRDANGALLASAPAPADRAPSTVKIDWRDSLDLRFAPSDGGDGALEHATFLGDVQARGEAFTLNAATLDAVFVKGAGNATDIQQLTASGEGGSPAIAQRANGTAGLQAKSLELTLRPGPSGDVTPAKLVATDDVEAHDPKQTLWTSTLTVNFFDPALRAASVPSVDAKPAVPPGEKDMAAEISSVEGRGGVLARLHGTAPNAATPQSSAWVFGDTLDGDGTARTLAVAGNDVWIVRERVVADRLGQLQFDEAAQTAVSVGTGRVRAFHETVAPAGDGKVERPALPERVALQAIWNESFVFDQLGGAGQGAIHLRGAVEVRSTPDRASTDLVRAASLRLELLGKDEGAGAGAGTGAGSSEAAGGGAGVAAGGIRHVKAEGNASFESRRWQNEAREGGVRLFRLKGEHIEYDIIKHEGFVDGPGELLTEVPDTTSDTNASTASAPIGNELGNELGNEPANEPAKEQESFAGAPVALGARGTTHFDWKRRLDLVSTGVNRSTVTMSEKVSVSHAGPKQGDATLTLSDAAHLEADLERQASDASKSTIGADSGGADLGGTAKILGMRAFSDGATPMKIQSEDFHIQCDGFTYDVASQVATITAGPGRSVSVLQHKKSPVPIKAESVTWNLATGILRVHGLRGAVTR